MIGDPLIISEYHRENASQIISQIKEGYIVLIGGSSGTAKSETAHVLQQELFKVKLQSLILSLDDLYLVHPIIRDINRKKQGITSVGIKEIDWELIKHICNNFKKKKTIKFNRYHRFLDAIEEVKLSGIIDVLIIEGLYANYLRKFKIGNLSLYMEGSPHQTLAFRLKRGKENEENKFRKKVVQKEFNVVCQLKKYADKIISFKGE